jgi:hypothetical protein
MVEPLAALFVTANPSGTDPLRLDRELRVINEALSLGHFRDRWRMDIRPAATANDLRRALLGQQRYELVHISGHGEQEGLILEDEHGEAVQIPPQWLAQLFAKYVPPRGQLRCVVLNACWSLSSGEPTALEVPFTIAMAGAVSDRGALEFSRGFYDALGNGLDFARAYEEGLQAVGLVDRSFKSVLLTGSAASPPRQPQKHIDELQLGQTHSNKDGQISNLLREIDALPAEPQAIPPVAQPEVITSEVEAEPPTGEPPVGDKTINSDSLEVPRSDALISVVPALVLVWSREEPERIGEVVLVESRSQHWVLGRETADNRNDPDRLKLTRQRPGRNETTGQIRSTRVSREQLELRATAHDRIGVRNSGSRTMLINGTELQEATLAPGDVLEIRKTDMFLCTLRPQELPARFRLDTHDTRGLDHDWFVGESPAIWELREQLAFAAGHDAHVFLRGPSGGGKDVAAAMIHSLSSRASAPFVACDATMVEAAELFGSAEQPGLIDAAADGTLFVQHVGELAEELHARVLRLLDDGEYQRVGETQIRRVALRFIGASEGELTGPAHELAHSMKIPIEVPGLDARREDIPLLMLQLLRKIAASDAEIAARFFVNGDPKGWPRVTESLIRELLTRPYTNHVRELEQKLYTGMLASPGDFIEIATSPGQFPDTGRKRRFEPKK